MLFLSFLATIRPGMYVCIGLYLLAYVNFRNPSSSTTMATSISFTRDVGPTATPPTVTALNNTDSTAKTNRISETPVKPIETIIAIAIALVTIIPEVVKRVVQVMVLAPVLVISLHSILHVWLGEVIVGMVE